MYVQFPHKAESAMRENNAFIFSYKKNIVKLWLENYGTLLE